MFGGACGVTVPAFADLVTITLGSWRTEDIAVWQDKIMPVFRPRTPTSRSSSRRSTPTNTTPPSRARSKAAPAPDHRLPSVRREHGGSPTATSTNSRPAGLELRRYRLAPGPTGRLAVLRAGRRRARRLLLQHGIFDELGLEVPRPRPTSSTCCRRSRTTASIRRSPWLREGWQLAYNVLYYIGPNYWKGEEGRLGLIDGTQKLTDPDFVAAFKLCMS